MYKLFLVALRIYLVLVFLFAAWGLVRWVGAPRKDRRALLRVLAGSPFYPLMMLTAAGRQRIRDDYRF